MKLIKYFFILLFMLLCSCESKEILYPSTQKVMVMNATIAQSYFDNILYLHFTGSDSVTAIIDADVSVYVNGELVQQINEGPKGEYILDFDYVQGDKVRIEATTADSQYHTWAEVTVPEMMHISSVDIVYERVSDYAANKHYSVHIKDLSPQTDYYRMTYIQKSDDETELSCWRYSSHIILPPDPILTDGYSIQDDGHDKELYNKTYNRYLIFNDSKFAGSEAVLKFYKEIGYQATWPLQDSDDIQITVYSITEEEFNYLRQMNVVASNSIIPEISEPLRLPSNVRGGTGFVSISNGEPYIIAGRKE